MRYVYKRFAKCKFPLLLCVCISIKIIHANESHPEVGTADEKTVAVLNEMLVSLQQQLPAEKKDEALVLPQDSSLTTKKDEGNNKTQQNVVGDQTTSLEGKTAIVSPDHISSISQNAVVETAAYALPQAPVVATGQEVKSIEEENINEKVGIDTLNLPDPQGNWLYKSIWYERAQERYENIRKLVDFIWDFKNSFTEKRTELDRTILDPFYINLGLRMGELQEVLSALVNKFDAERNKDGDLNVQERSLLQEVKSEQLLIENLHNQVKVVTELDHRIDDSLDRLMEQLGKVRAYERDAWNNFKKISQLLSDTKARELYYAMDIQMRNIKDIQRYLQNEFKPYFQTTIDRVAQEIKSIQQSIERLKEQGVDFKTQADVLFETIIHPVKKEVAESKVSSEDVREAGDDKMIPHKPTVLKRVFYWVGGIMSVIITPIKILFNKIFG
ncbi:MAG TPA: hypothetical protein VL201_04105 [Patescibacteria group bacterium]|jgi:hypothetical protein|nr:hypothetical protein [Patescibacteria group bacterium]